MTVFERLNEEVYYLMEYNLKDEIDFSVFKDPTLMKVRDKVLVFMHHGIRVNLTSVKCRIDKKICGEE